MADAARTLVIVGAELEGVAGQLVIDSVVVMPPTVAAEVATAVIEASTGLQRVAAGYALIAADLAFRAGAAEAGEAVGSAGAWTLSGGFGLTFGVLPGLGRGLLPLGAPGTFGPVSGAIPPWLAGVVTGDGEDLASTLADDIDLIRTVASNSAVSKLTRFDGVFIKLASSPVFEDVSRGFAVIGGTKNLYAAYNESEGENVLGRDITMQASVATDFAFEAFPVLDLANTLSGNAVRADATALYTMGGHAVSDATDAAYDAAVHDLHDHDYLGLVADVPSAAIGGAIGGLNKGLNSWADSAADGEFGGFVQGMSRVENDVIDAHYEQATHVVHAAGHAVSATAHSVTGFVKHLF